MKRDDILWKAALEDLFDDFLRFFFTDADTRFDFSKKFQYLDKELEQLFPPDNDIYAPRYVDKLVKVLAKMGILEKRSIEGNNYYLNLELYRILGELVVITYRKC